MLHEGLAKLLPSLAKGGDGPASPVPATIFAKLLRHPQARLAICSESQALRTLFAYMSRDGHDTTTIDLLSSIVCDLLVHANTRHKAVADGLVAAVVDLARRTQWSNARLVAALLLLAASDDTRMDAVQDDSVHMLLAYLEPSSGHEVASPVTWTVVTALCHLGWHDVTRSHLHDPRVVVALVTLVLPRLLTLLQDPSAASTTPASTVLDATLLTLASLSFRPDHANTMLQHGICLALVGVATLPALPPLHRRLVCLLLRQVSHADSFHALLHVRDSRQPVLALVCTLCLHPSSGFLDDVAALDCADALCSIAAVDGLAPKLVVEAMVDLHCTNTLVRVARSSAANHPTLQMCTLTLMHLSVDAGNAAAQMVAEDAVSALLHLSTFDSDVVRARIVVTTRDACSLALANLSHESPPVPSGSVLALIHLSMHGKSTTSSSPTSGGCVAHPPHITTSHHESNAAPPVYTYDEVDYATMMAAKYVADVADRQPPIPHLPTITVDPESLHASMDNPGGGSSNVTSSSAHDHDELSTAQQLVFQKIEPTDPTQ
ncbi:hypothetical protein DYB37_002068 [Aphanomyces astaci]|uniref:Uncharacterized protein n=1 Tax=Aphanomyces astaci TaxID=112090 RepID=A0A418EDB7_APHAT|nr:hypothetical protein DYB37_002068 [Aphanomyces astaci]